MSLGHRAFVIEDDTIIQIPKKLFDDLKWARKSFFFYGSGGVG